VRRGRKFIERGREGNGTPRILGLDFAAQYRLRPVYTRWLKGEIPEDPRMKIRVSLLVLAALAVWALDFAAAQNERNPAAPKVLALEKKWNDVYKRGDIAAMNSLLADDFIITVEDGSTFSKPGYIAHNGDSAVHVEISEMSDLQVRMHGNTAVVTGAYHEKGTEKGKPYEYRDRLTDVWVNLNGRWQVIASHYSLRANQ
jgi:ketosteroid isomerase-like protein